MSSDETVPWFDARYVYFSIFHWHDLVNGYSGFFPPSYAKLTARERDFPSREALDFLRGRGVDYIAVHGAFYGPERYPTIVAQLDRAPGLQLVIAAPWEGSESRLYRLQR